MSDAEIAEKKDPALRLPRQAEDYRQTVGDFLAVKNSREIAGAIQVHFERPQKYDRQLLGLATDVEATAARIDSGRRRAGDRVTYDRSAVMRAVKSRDTSPERAVRALLHPIAPGYRLHRGDLPGKPDIVYASRKLAIFVHGCFWHGHDCPRGARMPETNAAYWRAKITRNRARDEKTLAAYATMGWRALVVHECELKDKGALSARLAEALRLK